jgi:hypothetical protein
MTASFGSIRSRRPATRVAIVVLMAATVALIVALAIKIPAWVRATEAIAEPEGSHRDSERTDQDRSASAWRHLPGVRRVFRLAEPAADA